MVVDIISMLLPSQYFYTTLSSFGNDLAIPAATQLLPSPAVQS